jgi:hypothetical protein
MHALPCDLNQSQRHLPRCSFLTSRPATEKQSKIQGIDSNLQRSARKLAAPSRKEAHMLKRILPAFVPGGLDIRVPGLANSPIIQSAVRRT